MPPVAGPSRFAGAMDDTAGHEVIDLRSPSPEVAPKPKKSEKSEERPKKRARKH